MSSHIFRQLYYRTTGYSFTHMGRLFLRLFIGIMLVQFGVRQLAADLGAPEGAPLPFLAYGLDQWMVIVVEIICPFFIMIGLFTRIAIIPPFVLMIFTACGIYTDHTQTMLGSIEMLTIPFLFMGVFLFMLLTGAGKISVDYFYSLYLINKNKGSEEELELV